MGALASSKLTRHANGNDPDGFQHPIKGPRRVPMQRTVGQLAKCRDVPSLQRTRQPAGQLVSLQCHR